MKLSHKIHITLTATLLATAAHAQNMTFNTDTQKASAIQLSQDTVRLGYNSDFTSVAVLSNCTYNITPNAADTWLTCVKEANGNLTLFGTYQYKTDERTTTLSLESADGKCTRNLTVIQNGNTAATTMQQMGDKRLTATGVASAYNTGSGEGIEKTYDGDNGTLYHSPYSGTTFPITLTYTLAEATHVDYLAYTPRQDGNTNGNFKEIVVEYTLTSAPSTWVTLKTTDLGGSSSTSKIDFGDNGTDNVSKVRITVNSGQGGWASCAEMGFYQKDQTLATMLNTYFEDALCSKLKTSVTAETAASITQPYVKQLVYTMLDENYSTNYRVGEFEAYRPLGELSSELKTSNYNAYENPTGIYFDKGENLVLFVEGIGSAPVSLIVKSFGEASYEGEGHPESSYGLSNGVNVITTKNRGNGYISYYTSDYSAAPKVKIHFALAKENGYFDLDRGDTNTDWQTLLANAVSDIIDVRTKRMQVACPLNLLKSKCPAQGRELAQIYDNTIYREREMMGLIKFDKEPKNRQFARPVDSGMFADGTGAAAAFGSFGEWVNPNSFGFWGFAHELGHVNQVRPGLKWVGCGETTNNIYSAWVEHSLGTGYHRLEDENSGVNDYNGIRGGRFETYLEEGVRKGVSWQLQDGPDYHGTTPTSVTVNGQDYDGNSTGSVSTTKRNYDHFVKVVPLWQLTLYTQQAEMAKDAYGKVIEGIRNYTGEGSMTDGQLQIKFMRSFCDSTKINFLPFFEKAGMLKPIDAYIEDYSPGWLKISQTMIDDLKTYIAAKGYPEAPAALNYINAYNWQTFRDKAVLTTTATLGSGCTKLGSGRIQVDNEVWQNAVGYETYDAEGNLLRISMFGLGASQQTSRYTQVLWPNTVSEKSAYIMAVGFDGTRVKCYEP